VYVLNIPKLVDARVADQSGLPTSTSIWPNTTIQMNLSYEVLQTNAATQEHINLVRVFLRVIAVELLKRGETHDLSKMSPEEVDAFTEYTPKLKTCIYGSNEYKRYLAEIAPALEHHYKCSRHHPEHFDSGIRGMNLVDILELFCDWTASTKRHADGDINRSIEINQKRFNMSDDLVAIFKNTIELLERP